MRCQIISIGNELLTGDTANTNAGWIGRFLAENGLETTRIHTIGDDLDMVKKTVREALSESPLVIATGGLGPTHDDITKKAVQEHFGCEMVLHEPTLNFIREMFKKRNMPMSESNYHQAEVPDCCEVLFNSRGTAPGMWFDRKPGRLAVLPGVPREMKHLMRDKILPEIERMADLREQRYSRYILTAGVGESTLSDEIIGDLSPRMEEGVSVAYLPDTSGNRIRISGYGSTAGEAAEKIRPVTEYILKKAGNFAVGEGRDLTLPEAVGQLLRDKNLSISIAESCTGGSLSDAVTDIPGSSDYMKGGIVAYSDEMKTTFLGIPEDLLRKHGAVSREVSLQMAKNIAERCDTDIGISATGIAGPGGGTKDKPVGTVWIGFRSRNQHFSLKARFTKDRLVNKERTVAVALDTVRRAVSEIGEMPYGLEKQRD